MIYCVLDEKEMRDIVNSKIIFLDLDGTLVHPDSTVSENNKEAIKQARKNGHLVYICTGRSLCGIDQELKELAFDGIIASAGSYIEMNGTPVYTNYLDQNTIKRIRNIFEENDVSYTLEASDCTYTSESLIQLFALKHEPEQMNSEMQRLCNEAKKAFSMKPLEEYQEDTARIHKVSFVAKNREQLVKPKKALKKDFTFVVHDIFPGDTLNGEIIASDVNKATAIYKVLEILNRDITDTIAFGDSMNDYEMIEAVTIGIAMKNAPQRLKDIASNICKDVNDDAIYHEFKRLQLV